MHGAGNDYIYFDLMAGDDAAPAIISAAPRLSHRHFGIGGDGVVLMCPSAVAHCTMRMHNADGSEGKMCGNAIRCVGKYLYEHGYVTSPNNVTVETKSGIKTLQLTLQSGIVTSATVNMGVPVIDAIDTPCVVAGSQFQFTAVNMGNPHAVVFTNDDVDTLEVAKFGSAFGQLPLFPDGVNVEFCNIIGDNSIKMRVWERGSGETLACGTGACAAAVAAVATSRCSGGSPITVHLRGGALTIDVTDGGILMTGNAVTVFDGEITI
jgi:diaminopimelate epimerase